jgi:hypothetical protein
MEQDTCDAFVKTLRTDHDRRRRICGHTNPAGIDYSDARPQGNCKHNGSIRREDQT